MTTADWLRRAADAWTEADAAEDSEARRAKILVAEGCERLAEHAAFLAEGVPYPPVGWFHEMKRFVERICLPFGLRFQRLGMAEVPLKPSLCDMSDWRVTPPSRKRGRVWRPSGGGETGRKCYGGSIRHPANRRLGASLCCEVPRSMSAAARR